MISKIKQKQIRAKASSILQSLKINSPEEIDLEIIAWELAKISIAFGGLISADGWITNKTIRIRMF